MPIWIDYRERSILSLTPTGKSFSPPVGDIWIGDLSGIHLAQGGVILERKTVADLEASFLDGRYHEQRGRLLSYSKEHNVAIGYIIEGKLKGWVGRLEESALEKILIRLQFHHRIPVLRTSSIENTVRIIEFMEEQWIKDKGQLAWQYETGSISTPVAVSYVKSECRDTSTAFLMGTLMQCRGVSEGIAKLIMKHYPSLDSILKATSDEISELNDSEHSKRKIGKAVAERLYGLFHNTIQETPLRTIKVKMQKPTQCTIQEDI